MHIPTGRRLNLAVAGGLLFLAIAFMAGGLPPGRAAAPMDGLLIYPPWQSHYPSADPVFVGGDLLLQQLPWHEWIHQEITAGRFPLWVPGPLGGSPLFADYQSGVLYPLHLLWALMPTGAGLGIVMALKLWLAGLGMWLFLRAMRLNPAAAGLSAIGLMFSAWMVDLLPWQISSGYLLLPWLAWAVYACYTGGGRMALAAIATLTAFAIFAGHPETLVILSYVICLWALGLLLASPLRTWVNRLGGLALGASLGIALGAIQLVPFVEALGLSHAITQRPGGAGWAALHLPPEYMANWVLPRFLSYPPDRILGGPNGYSFTESNGYIGLPALLGLVFAVAAGVRRELALRLVLPWAGVVVVSWLVTYDDALGKVIRSLPGFGQSLNTRWFCAFAFAGLTVSAFGWDWFARQTAVWAARPGHRLAPLKIGGWALLAVGTGLLAAHAAGLLRTPVLKQDGHWQILSDQYRIYWAAWAVAVAFVILGVSALWATEARARRYAPLVLGAVLIADLWRLLIGYNSTAPASEYFPQTSFLTQLRIVPPTERILVEGDVFPANSGLVYAVRDWRSQDALAGERSYRAALMLDPTLTRSVWNLYNMFLHDVRLPVAPMLGMSYFIFPAGTDPNTRVATNPGQPTFTRLANKDGLGLWRAEGVPGFAYLSQDVQAVAGEKAAAIWLRGVTWQQVRAYAALVEAPASAVEAIRPAPVGSRPNSSAIEEYSPGQIRVRTSASGAALLVVAESWYPGWRATLDGQQAQILRTNYLSQGVVVPAGTHTVELRYVPDSFTEGAAISGLALAALVVLIASRRRREVARDEEQR